MLFRSLSVEDNGIGMGRDEMAEALGTIARSGTRAFLERVKAAKDDGEFIGQFGIGFYSAFMFGALDQGDGATESYAVSADDRLGGVVQVAAGGVLRAHGMRR